MKVTPRENLLQTLRGDEIPQWIPVCPHLFPNENPAVGIPDELEEVFDSSSGALALDILRLGEYLGAEDYMIPVSAPATLITNTCPVRQERIDDKKLITIMSTPAGDLRQVTSFTDGAPSFVTERYVKTTEDAVRLTEYFKSLQVQPVPKVQESIKDIRQLVDDKGILFCRTAGTPLGMCYRIYFNLTDLIYMNADAPDVIGELFGCMEEKYLRLYDCMLNAASEIDAYLGMDDTSTTMISPAMFEQFNVEVTNKRSDLCHRFGKIYLHHSCGRIRDLLPAYRKTRMNGVDAFTAPPIGNVGYAEGRELLGAGFSIRAGLSGGLQSSEKNAIQRHVALRLEDARAAGNVAFSVGGASLTFQTMKQIFENAMELNHF